MVMAGCSARVGMATTAVMVGLPAGSVMVVMVGLVLPGRMVVRAVLGVRVGCSWVTAAMVVLVVQRPMLLVWVVWVVRAVIPGSWGGVWVVLVAWVVPAGLLVLAVMAVMAVRRGCCPRSVMAVRAAMVVVAARPVVRAVGGVAAGA